MNLIRNRNDGKNRTALSKRSLAAVRAGGVIGMVLLVSGVWAASLPLPLYETFATALGIDTAKSTARVSLQEQAVLLAFKTRAYGALAGTVGADISVDVNNTRALGVGDMDGDGDLDVISANRAQTNRLYLNNGTATPFAGVTGRNIGTQLDDTRAIAVADMDGDGDLDVVVGNASSQVNRLYQNNGTSDPFSGVTPLSIGAELDNTVAIAVADMDGDGDLDVVAGNSLAASRLYLNNGTLNPFNAAVAHDILVTGTTNDRTSIAVGDMNNDGRMDIVAGNYNQICRLYLNNGTADPFVGNSGVDLTANADNTQAVALADMDGDGDLDIVVGNLTERNKIYVNQNNAASFYALDISTDADATRALGVADIDNDGDVDVVAGNSTGGKLRLYMNTGTGATFSASDVSSDTKTTYALVTADFDGNGTPDLATGNDSAQTNRLYLNAAAPNPFFGVTGSNISSDTNAGRKTAVGDMDGDGDLDVVIVNAYEATRLYLNTGTANPFGGVTGLNVAAAVTMEVATALAIGDVDGDGDIDVVRGNNAQRNTLYLNNGTANPFNGVTGSYITNDVSNARAVALADMDGDGDLDYVSAGASSQIRLYLNNGTASPFSGVTGSNASSDAPNFQSLAIADMDGDGDLDIVAGVSLGQNRLYLNNGTAAPFSGGTGSNIDASALDNSALAVADVDSDGDVDVVTGNYNQATRLYLNNGSAAPFSGVVGRNISGSLSTMGLALADLNDDGKPDAVVVTNTQGILFLVNNGTSDPFAGVVSRRISNDAAYYAGASLADMDGDGRTDLVVAGDTNASRIYLNAAPAEPINHVVGSNVGADVKNTHALVTADMDGDGDLDVISGDNAQSNRLYLNNGSPTPFLGVTSQLVSADFFQTYSLAVGDMDGDGDQDVVAGYWLQAPRLYLNNGTASPFNGVSGVAVGADTGSKTISLALADVDGDGDLDVVAGNFGLTKRLYLNNGTSAPFNAVTGSNIGAETDNPYALAAADMDGDGDLDLVAGNAGAASRLYLNNGTAAPFSGVTAANITSDSKNTYALVVRDFDGDGDLDVVTGNSGQTKRLYLNNGSATPFSAVTGSDVSSDTGSTRGLAAVDYDRDGDLDVVAGNSNSMSRVYLNNGTAAPFSGVSGINLSTDTYDVRAVVAGDFDRDGETDFVMGNYGAVNRFYKRHTYNTSPQTVRSLHLLANPASDSFYFAATTAFAAHTRVSYQLSNNGGLSWKWVKPGSTVTFPSTGTDVVWRAQLSSLSPATTPAIRSVTVVNRLADSDVDGATDGAEVVAGTNLTNADTDGDGMSDGFEITNTLNPLVNDAALDPDTDGLSNGGESTAGTNPRDADSDNDGMNDGPEVANALNPLVNDAALDPDTDGLGNAAELTAGTDPHDADSDNDGMNDGPEVASALNPLVNDAALDPDTDGLGNAAELTAGTDPHAADTDNDGMNDGYEVANTLNPLVNDASDDPDSDALINSAELTAGTDPQDVDTDNDGLNDGYEVANTLNPLVNDASGDPDSDGLNNAAELTAGTDPQDADSDNDGMNDGPEVANGLNPLVYDAYSDPDMDALNNAGELTAGTNPFDLDSDNDGMNDGPEVSNGLNPLVDDAAGDADLDGASNGAEISAGTNPQIADTDGDGIEDGVELVNALNPLVNDAAADADADGLTNSAEITAGTGVHDADSDNDGIEDGAEVANNLNPLLDDAAADADNDGLGNADELTGGTDPQLADSDGDGLLDGVEVKNGLDPLDPKDADADTDGDGTSNADEILAGTDLKTADPDPEAAATATKRLSHDDAGGCSTAGHGPGEPLGWLLLLGFAWLIRKAETKCLTIQTRSDILIDESINAPQNRT